MQRLKHKVGSHCLQETTLNQKYLKENLKAELEIQLFELRISEKPDNSNKVSLVHILQTAVISQQQKNVKKMLKLKNIFPHIDLE